MPMEPDIDMSSAPSSERAGYHEDVDLGEAVGRGVARHRAGSPEQWAVRAAGQPARHRMPVGGRGRLMDEWNVSKEDGRSVIEVHREVCQFQCGSLCHPQAAEVYGLVIDMMSMNEGSRPRVTRLQDTGTCCTTSLAIAFGLLHTSPSEWRHHAHQQEPAGLP
jgi:hypothetical protein